MSAAKRNLLSEAKDLLLLFAILRSLVRETTADPSLGSG